MVNVTLFLQDFKISVKFSSISFPFTLTISSSGAIPFLSVSEFGSTFFIITLPFSFIDINPKYWAKDFDFSSLLNLLQPLLMQILMKEYNPLFHKYGFQIFQRNFYSTKLNTNISKIIF